MDSKLSGPRLQRVPVAFWMIAGCNQRESLGSKVMIVKCRLLPGPSILRFYCGLVDELTKSWDNSCLSGKLNRLKFFLSFGTLVGVSSKYGLLPTPARRLQWFLKNQPLTPIFSDVLKVVFVRIIIQSSTRLFSNLFPELSQIYFLATIASWNVRKGGNRSLLLALTSKPLTPRNHCSEEF